MVRIERIDRIGMAVADLGPQIRLLEGLFGFEAGPRVRDEAGGVEHVRLAVPGRSEVDWALMAPLGEHSWLRGFIDGPQGPGLHHVLMIVEHLDEAIEELRALDIEPWSEGSREPGGTGEIFVHPRHGGHGFQFRFRAAAAADSVPPRPMPREGALGIVAVNHLSHAHSDRGVLSDWYARALGMESAYRSDDPSREFETEVMETPTRQMRWEVIQPLGDHSFIADYIRRRGHAIHHVTFEVGDWSVALDACERHGVAPFGERSGVTDGARWSEAFLHPRQTGGMLVQFFWEERAGIWV